MTRRPAILAASLAALAFAVYAACNPEVKPTECTAHVEETCGGVTPPSASGVKATADCGRFSFELQGVGKGSEKISRTRHWFGGTDCWPDEDLGTEPRDLPPSVSWEAVDSRGNSFSGTGSEAVFDRGSNVCSATCTFTLTVSPTKCSPPEPVKKTGTAVFENAVTVTGGGPRVCTTSESHSAHRFPYAVACAANKKSKVTGNAEKVSDDGAAVIVRGTAAGDAAVTVSADCGSDEKSFDVVELDRLTLRGCGCIDGDDPAFETMEGKGEVTGALTTKPAQYSDETYATVDTATRTAHGWFDCERDGVEAEDEPRTNRTYEVVRLGKVEPVDEDCKGNTNKLGVVKFVIGKSYELTETDGKHLKGKAHLEIVDLKPKEKLKKGEGIVYPVLSGDAGSWKLDVTDEKVTPGTLTLRLTDSEHHCGFSDFDFEIVDCACECSSCDQFGKMSGEDGCIELRFGLGRNANGTSARPLRATLERTDILPPFASQACAEGRVDVSITNGTMCLAFRRTGAAAPVATYRLTPGADTFLADEYRDGVHLSRIRWTVSGGVWTMESLDPSDGFAPIASESLTIVTNGATVAERRTRGGTVSETRWRDFPGIGSFAFEETVGSGADAMTTYRAPVTSGPASGALLSEVRPDGSWVLNSYDAEGRLASVTTPFGDTAPMLDDSHAVIGYNAHVRKTVYGYAPVDPRDDGTCHPRDPRTTSEYVGSDADGWRLVSRAWAAQYVSGNERYDIAERAASAQASYGDATNPRTVSCYHWRNADAGELKWRVGEDGLKTGRVCSHDGLARTTTTMTAPLSGAVPFRTTFSREFMDAKGDVLREETWLVTDGAPELLSWTSYVRDAAGREIRRETSSGEVAERAYACCGPEWTRDERGIVTDYVYDSAGREIVTQRGTVQTETRYDLAGRVSETVRRGVGTGLALASTRGYDTAGRLAWSVGEDGVRTEYRYGVAPEGGEVRTTVRAAGTDCAVTNTTVSYRDGGTKATYLNGILKSTEVREPFAETAYEGPRGTASPRWSRTETDFLGRTIAETHPGFRGALLVTSNAYDSANRLVSTRAYSQPSQPSSPSPLVFTSFTYDSLGDRIATVSDRNLNGVADLAGPDLVSSNETRYVKLGNDWWRESRQFSYHRDDSAEPQLMSTTRTRLTGLGSTPAGAATFLSPQSILVSESVSVDLRGNATTRLSVRDRDAATETTVTRYPTSTTPATTISSNGLLVASTSQTGVTTTYGYDELERQISQTDGRGNTTRTVYDAQGRVSSTIDALGHATTCGYDALGRQTAVTDPLTNTVYTAYDAEGRVLAQRGATYPVDYTYDAYGNKTSMTTYRNENLTNGDTTRWFYDEPSGCMTNKLYADGKGPTYDYTTDGKLARRVWARGIVTDYFYDASGTLTNTVYSDDTPTVSLAYNRAGRQVEARDAAGVTTFAYDDFGENTNETVIGVAGTNVLERFYDALGRNTGYALNGVRQTTLAYDPVTGRLVMMTTATGGAGVPPAQNESDQNHCSPSPSTFTSFQWSYLQGSDLKTSLTYPNGLIASWTYDANNQLLQVRNATPTNGISQFDYAYDAAGRRTAIAKSGTAFEFDDVVSYGYNARSELTNAVAALDTNYRYSCRYDPIGNRESSSERGTNTTYAANELNQYTQIAVEDEDAFIPEFDDDGNQTLVKTATGIWLVTYNGENRPIRWTCGTTNIVMSYDRMGRRVTKNDQRFVCDGYLQICNFHFTATAPDYNYFTWDPTESVATRPLMWKRGDAAAYYTHDGNKNVSENVGASGVIVAHYEYADFGAIIAQTGDSAVENPWRFSSEFVDADLGLIYYVYRHVDSMQGRWLARDPAYESGGVNLYGFCENNGMYGDLDGLVSIKDILYGIGSVGISKELFRYPLGPGFVILNLNAGAGFKNCCNQARGEREVWMMGEVELELYYQFGYHEGDRRKPLKERKVKGRDRNKKVPHPCEPRMIKEKYYNQAVKDCRRKERGPKDSQDSFNAGVMFGCESCPERFVKIEGALFARFAAGIGFGIGVLAQGNFTPTIDDPLSLENISGDAYLGSAGKGVSIDVGGNVHVDFALERIGDQSPAPLPLF